MTDLGVGQKNEVVLGGGCWVEGVGVGGGDADGVDIYRLGGLCAGALSRTAQVLDRTGTR